MVTSWEQVSAKMMSKNAQNRSKLLEIARFLSLASARKQTCVLTVCQQQHWQVFEHCSNSRIKASVGTKSVPTLDMSVQTFERNPCQKVQRKAFAHLWEVPRLTAALFGAAVAVAGHPTDCPVWPSGLKYALSRLWVGSLGRW